jgi:hypothetical protein
MVRIRIHRLQHVIRNSHNHSIDLEPIIQPLVLLFVESADFLILHLFELLLRFPVLFQTLAVDAVQQSAFDLAAPRIFEGCAGCVLELKDTGFGARLFLRAVEGMVATCFEITRVPIGALVVSFFADVLAAMTRALLLCVPLSFPNHFSK